VRLTFANTDTLDQILLRRFGGKVERGLAAELSRCHDFSNRVGFCAAPAPRATVGKMNPSIQRGIMAKRKLMFAVEQRGT
jgi:hypothetical protein